MWTKESKKKPEADQNYEVFGIVNKGTKNETKQQFQAYFNTDRQEWEDHSFDDINTCENVVEFWFDFDFVEKPM